MKAIFSMSVASALLSLLAVLVLSAISIVPRPGAEAIRVSAMGVGAIFFFIWLVIALWAGKCCQSEGSDQAPVWLRQVLLGVSVVYCLAVILGILA